MLNFVVPVQKYKSFFPVTQGIRFQRSRGLNQQLFPVLQNSSNSGLVLILFSLGIFGKHSNPLALYSWSFYKVLYSGVSALGLIMDKRRLNVSNHKHYELVCLQLSPKKGKGKADCSHGSLLQTSFSLYKR